jgi:hypothetical protein
MHGAKLMPFAVLQQVVLNSWAWSNNSMLQMELLPPCCLAA